MNKIVSFLFLQHLYLGIVIIVIIPHNQCPDVRVVWSVECGPVMRSRGSFQIFNLVYFLSRRCLPGGWPAPALSLVLGCPARGPAPANPCKPTPAPRISSSPPAAALKQA